MKQTKLIMQVCIAFTASLCCITPLLAFIAGKAALATNFSLARTFTSYLIGLTILFLGFALVSKLKPKNN